MSTNIPEKLRPLGISPFIHRANQLERLKPPIAYWTYYHTLNTIISHSLQSADPSCTSYATLLMDKLEDMKTAHAADSAFTDDLAGQAYVEQFALETFERADKAVRANAVSKQTADTFQAAAVFLELLQIWQNPPPAEIREKIKYAKWNALRIAKAVKAGEDPNASNPVVPDEPEVPGPGAMEDGGEGYHASDGVRIDPNDPDVRKINGIDTPVPPRTASVEDAPDEYGGYPPPHQQQQPAPQWNQTSQEPLVSPPEAAPQDPQQQQQQHQQQQPPQNPRSDSLGGGYFPASPPAPASSPPASPAPAVSPPPANIDPNTFYTQQPSQQTPSAQPSPHPSAPAPTPPLQTPPLPRQSSLSQPHAASPIPSPPSFHPQTSSSGTPTSNAPPPAPGQAAAPRQSSYSQQPPTPHQHPYSTPPPPASAPAPQQPQRPHQPPPPDPYPAPTAPQLRPYPAQPQPQPQPRPYSAQPQSQAQPPYRPPPAQSQPQPQPQDLDDAALADAQKHARWAISALNFEDVNTAVWELRVALGRLGAG
ncbi:MAG: hypothetical protein M1831_000881 [Alyxoria varia]|nr:MAG: hypothetical protein M1831_000881 [Alyxoria varia]